MREASPALQEATYDYGTFTEKMWPEGESPRWWTGVTWSDDDDHRVQGLDFSESELLSEELEELPHQIGQLTALTKLNLTGCKQLKELPTEIGQLKALTDLGLDDCKQLTLAQGAEGQPAQTIVAAYARLAVIDQMNPDDRDVAKDSEHFLLNAEEHRR